MNIYYFCRKDVSFILHDNVDIDKLIKSIKKISRMNKILKFENFSTSDPKDNSIIIFIQKNILKVNFSHLYYDMYSIWLIFQKIDKIYKDEIENYKFNIYNEYSKLEFITNTLKVAHKIIPNIKYKNVYNSIHKKQNKKTIKILKTMLNELSTTKIIDYMIDKLNIKEYCLFINARKIFNEYEDVLGNLIYYSDVLKPNTNIRKSIHMQSKNRSLKQMINGYYPQTTEINSYLNFTLPSFAKFFLPIKTKVHRLRFTGGDYILIHPVDNDEKYIIIDYYHLI